MAAGKGAWVGAACASGAAAEDGDEETTLPTRIGRRRHREQLQRVEQPAQPLMRDARLDGLAAQPHRARPLPCARLRLLLARAVVCGAARSWCAVRQHERRGLRRSPQQQRVGLAVPETVRAHHVRPVRLPHGAQRAEGGACMVGQTNAARASTRAASCMAKRSEDVNTRAAPSLQTQSRETVVASCGAAKTAILTVLRCGSRPGGGPCRRGRARAAPATPP